jgi:hypothetical protein
MTTDGKFTDEGLIFLRLRQLSGFLPTHPLGIYSIAISLHGQGISLDYIEFSNMLLVVLFYLVLKGTYWLQQQG